MNLSLRNISVAAVLAATIVPAALAGGMNAKIEGPGKDGRTYTVRTYQCSNPSALKVAAWAEGVVDGKRQTLPLSIQKTGKSGVYQFKRSWPGSGDWLIRMELGDGHLPVTVTKLDAKGAVQQNELIWEGDPVKHCEAILAGKDNC